MRQPELGELSDVLVLAGDVQQVFVDVGVARLQRFGQFNTPLKLLVTKLKACDLFL